MLLQSENPLGGPVSWSRMGYEQDAFSLSERYGRWLVCKHRCSISWLVLVLNLMQNTSPGYMLGVDSTRCLAQAAFAVYSRLVNIRRFFNKMDSIERLVYRVYA